MRIARAVVLGVLLVHLGAVIRFAARTPAPVTTPLVVRDISTPGQPHDLARFDLGARVRVSSWDLHRRSHPLFAIDAEPAPTPLEAWAPGATDAAPWFEVRLGAPGNVAEVVLVFAPPTHLGQVSIPGYTLSCAAGGQVKKRWQSQPSDRARAVHQAPAHACDGVDRIRLELRPNPAGRVSVQLLEIEARG